MRIFLIAVMVLASFTAYAEGGCPPGQYPIGGQGVVGCAPIPGAGGGTAAPRPTGKWETRWGAIAEDSSSRNLATGTSTSQKSKRAAVSAAIEDCRSAGGKACKLRMAYHNQCIAMADPTVEFSRRQPEGSVSTTMTSAAETEELAKSNAMRDCQRAGTGQECSIVYSACSMSEFKAF